MPPKQEPYRFEERARAIRDREGVTRVVLNATLGPKASGSRYGGLDTSWYDAWIVAGDNEVHDDWDREAFQRGGYVR